MPFHVWPFPISPLAVAIRLSKQPLLPCNRPGTLRPLLLLSSCCHRHNIKKRQPPAENSLRLDVPLSRFPVSSPSPPPPKVCGYGTLLLATAAGIVCIVEGLKSHPEHIIMGAVIIFAAVQVHSERRQPPCTTTAPARGPLSPTCSPLQFALTARLYKNDLLQDRKVVYLSCFVVVALSAAGERCDVNDPWLP